MTSPVKSLTGHFLVASPALRDPNFAGSVILLVQHDDGGAIGVILNRPLELTVADAVKEEVEVARDVQAPLHLGGPCPGLLSVLHRTDEPGPRLLEGVAFTNDRGEIETLMRDHAEEVRDVKYIAGYAGWGPAQLESELAEDAWLVAPATADDVFRDPATLWKHVVTRLHLSQYVPPDRIPKEPGLN